jgi:hypothetical protein
LRFTVPLPPGTSIKNGFSGAGVFVTVGVTVGVFDRVKVVVDVGVNVFVVEGVGV